MENNNYILKSNNISKVFGKRKVLDNVSINIKKGEIITIVGPNGGGKSTLAKIFSGIIKPTSGDLWLKEKLRISYMPQKLYINNNMPITVRYFIGLNIKNVVSNNSIDKIAEKVNVKHILDQSIHNISGGEVQRVMLARSLLNKPDLFILDEPEQGVDINGQLEIYKLLKDINKELNIAILMIAHDLHFVMKSTNHVICLNHHICCEGKPEDLTKNKNYSDLFGNEAVKIMSLYSHDHDHVH